MPRAIASKFFFSLIVIAALAVTPCVVFAQHGGGGHGGGGGFHGGGGGGFRGGGSAGRGRSFGGSTGRSFGVAPSAPRFPGGSSFVRPGQNFYRPSTGNAPAFAGGMRSAGAMPAPSNGQWHAFGPQPTSAPNGGSSFAPGVSRAALPAGGPSAGAVTRSFVGQGNEIRETTPRSGVSAAIRPSAGMAGVGGATATTGSRMNSFQLGGSALAGSRTWNTWNTTRRPDLCRHACGRVWFLRLGSVLLVGSDPSVPSV